MKKHDSIIKKINADKAIMKKINSEEYYSVDQFIDDAARYIKAIKEYRMICCIKSVSSSGMSRTIKFLSCEKQQLYLNLNGHQHQYLNYFLFFCILDHLPASSTSNYFRIYGCGMDMIFNTNYNIIHTLCRLGFISNAQCAILAQNTPTVI